MKKVISILLSVLMLCSVTTGLDLTAYAAEGKCGKNVSYWFNYSTGTLTITGTGDMYDYSFYGRESVFSRKTY